MEEEPPGAGGAGAGAGVGPDEPHVAVAPPQEMDL